MTCRTLRTRTSSESCWSGGVEGFLRSVSLCTLLRRCLDLSRRLALDSSPSTRFSGRPLLSCSVQCEHRFAKMFDMAAADEHASGLLRGLESEVRARADVEIC